VAELMRDGVRLAYEEVGAGEPAIVFVHGWTCDRSHFAPQAAHYAATHRCVSVDLRGHGESDAPEQEYNIDVFADDVGQLGVKNAVLIGHSMGGAVVLALATQRPELARAVIMLDPAILFPAEVAQGIPQLAAAFAGPGGMDVLRQFEDGQFFLKTSDAAWKKSVLDAAMKTPQHVVASAFGNLTKFEADAALRSLKAPAMYVAAAVQITDLQQVRDAKPDIHLGQTVGAGHFHQLEVPDQINAMIDRFLTINGLASG
jgi:pimeloyl-ACP methyl ester carboxylesterase